MDKKIAIIIRGLAYFENYRAEGMEKTIDYRLCLKNNIKYLFDNLKKEGYELYFFIATYDITAEFNAPAKTTEKRLDDEKFKEELEKKYKEIGNDVKIYYFDEEFKKKFYKHKNDNSATYIMKHKRNMMMMKKCYDMMKKYETENSIEFDYILMLRFDLVFTKKITISMFEEKDKIIFNNINNKNENDDNFMLIPDKYKDMFFNKISDLINIGKSCHDLNKYLEKNSYYYPAKSVNNNNKYDYDLFKLYRRCNKQELEKFNIK